MRVPAKTLQEYSLKAAQTSGEESKKSDVHEPLSVRRILEQATPKSLDAALLVSASYDGEKQRAVLKLYREKDERIYLWFDDTGHQPYCFSDLEPSELMTLPALASHPGLERLEQVQKYEPLEDRERLYTKIVAKDPLSIGGRPSGSIRDIIPKAWEADIRYYECYIFDRDVKVGMPYCIQDGHLKELPYRVSPEAEDAIRRLFDKEPPEVKEHIMRWVNLLECPVPDYRRVALDIEVGGAVPARMPSAEQAEDPVIAVGLVDSKDRKRILLLKRESVEGGQLPEEAQISFFDDERSLLEATFSAIAECPFVITFNGDDFDLRYLYHRAQRLGFSRDQIPIELTRDAASLSLGVHIDLYKFFFNRSIQIYAFNQRYREVTLDDIGESLLGVGKVKVEDEIAKLSYGLLADYCLRDAEITMQLTKLENGLALKLATVLARISRTPIDDLTRQGVSGWIRNMLRYEHRRRDWLIPRPEDILEMKGAAATKAIIEGKKYRGAEVIQPEAGVHFNVPVLDFQSMYPSIISRYNLSYETVRCPHPSCKANKVPDTPHWVCTRKRGISSLVIGSLRDLRVKWYKPKSRDKRLPKTTLDWYNTIQSSLKVLLNASYGVFGSEAFFLYCPPVAEATASIGRYVITQTIERARATGMKVVYGDTDSIFLEAPSQDQVQKLIAWSEQTLGMELDIDKTYRYAVFSARKKNYLGVYPDGSVDIKGLTGKKRNTPEFLQKAFFDMIS
ncbi:MAG: DNA-directed DNA polymerase I, partial [Candidatus Bathyarchaeia archaeon]